MWHRRRCHKRRLTEQAAGQPAGLYYLVTSHEAQVAEGLAALCDLSGPLVCDVLTPAGVHRLYGAAVLADGYQGCGTQRNKKRGVSLATCVRAVAAAAAAAAVSLTNKQQGRAGDVTDCDISFSYLDSWHVPKHTRARVVFFKVSVWVRPLRRKVLWKSVTRCRYTLYFCHCALTADQGSETLMSEQNVSGGPWNSAIFMISNTASLLWKIYDKSTTN